MTNSRQISKSSTVRTGITATRSSLLRFEAMGARSHGLLMLVMAVSSLMFLGGAYAQKAAAAGCENEAFRTGFGASLPDCRAYEQVTPADKYGAVPAGIPDNVVAAENGPGITFFSPDGSSVPSTGAGSTGDFPTFLSTLEGDSWKTQSLLAPQSLGVKSQFLGITPDLRYDVVQALNTDYEHPGFGNGLYLIDTETEAVTTIVSPPEDEAESRYAFDGASKDGSKIFFETEDAVPTAPGTPEAHGSDNLYMWERATGQITLAGVLPESEEHGEEPAAGAFGGAYAWFEGDELYAGGALAHNAVGALHAISPDGDQIYFTAAETGQLYLRRGLDGPDPTTIRVSEPNTGFSESTPPKPAAFQEATPDGSRAFFLSSAKLADGANTGATEQGKDLYRFDENAPPGERLTDITPDSNLETPNGAEVQGLLGISDDGASGYFVARGVLVAGVGAEAGRKNLYRFEESEGRINLTFVAVLEATASMAHRNGPSDTYIWSPRSHELGGIADFTGRSSRVSADGKVLIFTSQEPLTGYESTGEGCASGGQELTGPEFRCSEIFRYEVGSSGVTCLSCAPSGEPPLGAATLQSGYAFAKDGIQNPEEQPRVTFANNLSSDGDQVFFQTSQPLVGGDVNGTSGCPRLPEESAPQVPEYECQDVYEWEAVGTPGGSCTRAEVNGGCLYLLSNGESDRPSYFAGASADGSNVYILTTSQLVPGDLDRAVDVYDVRVDGGLASQNQVPTVPCEGEAGCRGAAAQTPASPTPASSSLTGPGNRKPPPACKKGQVRKNGKCVKKHKKNSKKQKKHNAGKHKKRPKKVDHIDGRASHRSSGRGGAK